MKIAIIGSNGQLGRAAIEALSNGNILSCYDIHNLDICVMNNLNEIMDVDTDVIINCAAFTSVDAAEIEVEAAYRVNAIGARNLAIVANRIGAKLVHISTDYVFEGNGILEGNQLRPYNEYDPTGPASVYGKSKLAGEEYVRQICKSHFIIRTAWLYGDGNNFVRTMLKLAETNKILKVVDDQHGTPTSALELTRIIEHLMTTENYGTFHGTCEGECTWFEFAKEIFRLANKDVEVIPCTTEEFPRPAPRPQYSVLDNFVLGLTTDFQFKHWKVALAEYMENEQEAKS